MRCDSLSAGLTFGRVGELATLTGVLSPNSHYVTHLLPQLTWPTFSMCFS